jgi:hypothetical protein
VCYIKIKLIYKKKINKKKNYIEGSCHSFPFVEGHKHGSAQPRSDVFLYIQNVAKHDEFSLNLKI